MTAPRSVWLIRADGSLLPADDVTRARVAKRAGEQVLMAEPRRPRNVRQHRLFWALLQKAVDAGADANSAEHLLAKVKFLLGRVDWVRLPDGRMLPSLQSIAFASMPQAEFDDFFKQALDIICHDFLHGADRDVFLRELERAA